MAFSKRIDLGRRVAGEKAVEADEFPTKSQFVDSNGDPLDTDINGDIVIPSATGSLPTGTDGQTLYNLNGTWTVGSYFECTPNYSYIASMKGSNAIFAIYDNGDNTETAIIAGDKLSINIQNTPAAGKVLTGLDGDGNCDWEDLPNQLKTITIEVTSQEILDCYTTPKELIPAPGTGKVIVPLVAIMYLDYNSSTYTNYATFGLYWDDNSSLDAILLSGESSLATTADRIKKVNGVSDYWLRTDIEDKPIILWCQTDIADGNSPIRLTIEYMIIDVSAI